MRLLGRNRLGSLYDKSGTVRKWTASWAAEVMSATWACPADVVLQFPNSKQENHIFVFPVIDCTLSIALLIAFPEQIAVITAVRAA